MFNDFSPCFESKGDLVTTAKTTESTEYALQSKESNATEESEGALVSKVTIKESTEYELQSQKNNTTGKMQKNNKKKQKYL